MRSLIDDDSAAVEEIPFRLLLIMLMISLSVYAASSGLAQLQRGRSIASLEENMDQFVRVGIAAMASGEGTRVAHVLEDLTGKGISLEALTIGGNFDAPQDLDDPGVYRFRLSNGVEDARLLASGSIHIKATNSSGFGFIIDTAYGEEAIHMVALECQGEMMLILLGPTEDFTRSDISDFKLDHLCAT